MLTTTLHFIRIINNIIFFITHLIKFMKNTPDVILLDYQMPLYNGANIMNMIQKNPDRKPVPVIILSGTLDRSSLQECYAYNPFAYLAKPASKDTLIKNIEKALAEGDQL